MEKMAGSLGFLDHNLQPYHGTILLIYVTFAINRDNCNSRSRTNTANSIKQTILIHKYILLMTSEIRINIISSIFSVWLS